MRLIVFDVDGTLVDSQADILAAMAVAFATVGRPVPARGEVLGIVGLSLDVAMAQLAPGADHVRMVQAYKDAYMELRVKTGAAESSPLYPGARYLLEALAAEPGTLLGVATGKSKRGLDKLVEAHGLDDFFVTRQVADFHPSKPHPSMLLEAMAEAGCGPAQTVMVGDTAFDMEMARAARVTGIGVTWGYHPVTALGAARHLVDDYTALSRLLAAEEGTAA